MKKIVYFTTFSHAITMTTAFASFVFRLLSYRNMIFNQSVCIFSFGYFLVKKQKTCDHVSIKLHKKHKMKFGRVRTAVGTLAAGKCFHSFFKFSQTFVSVSITRQKHRVHVFYFFQKTPQQEKQKQLVNLLSKCRLSKCKFSLLVLTMTSTARASCLSPSSYRNMIFNQSVHIFSQDCFPM